MDFIQIIQERIRGLKEQQEAYQFSDKIYYHRHIIRLEERIKELEYCIEIYQKLNSE
jgi:hypothetical protein